MTLNITVVMIRYIVMTKTTIIKTSEFPHRRDVSCTGGNGEWVIKGKVNNYHIIGDCDIECVTYISKWGGTITLDSDYCGDVCCVRIGYSHGSAERIGKGAGVAISTSMEYSTITNWLLWSVILIPGWIAIAAALVYLYYWVN